MEKEYLQRIIKEVLSCRFFIETDNDDVEIEDIYRAIARIKDVSLESLVVQMEANLINFTTD